MSLKRFPMSEWQVYAGYLKDDKELRRSSSGGAFYAIASWWMKQGGICYGAAMKENMEVSHIRVDSVQDLECLRTSKYVQSRIDNTFIQTKKDLLEGKSVLFSGTPCQIAGLLSFLGKKYDHLLLIDLICEGVPSPCMLENHIKLLSEDGDIHSLSFRDPSLSWENFQLSYVKNGEKIIISFNDDVFCHGFVKAQILRPSCYECRFRGKNSVSDIMIGDYWGIREVAPDFYNPKGVSAIIVKTDYGRRIFESCQSELELYPTSIKQVAANNRSLLKSEKRSMARDLIFKYYKLCQGNLNEVYHQIDYDYPMVSLGAFGSYNLRVILQIVSDMTLRCQRTVHITMTTISSIMSKAVDYVPEEYIQKVNTYRKNALYCDMNKEMKEILMKKPKPDFFVLDFLEERLGIYRLTDGSMLTNSEAFQELGCSYLYTDYRSMLDISLSEWEESCLSFIEVLKNNFLPEQILLAKLYLTEHYGEVAPEESFDNVEEIRKINQRLWYYYNFFENHFTGIHVIDIKDPSENYCNKYYAYGCAPQYYNVDWYEKWAMAIAEELRIIEM